MVRDYIAGEGSHCPYCKSREIESDRVEADGDSAWARVECHDCGRQWHDVFLLRAIDEIAEDGSTTTVTPAADA
jgi:hypothetical protein